MLAVVVSYRPIIIIKWYHHLKLMAQAVVTLTCVNV